MSCQSYLHNFIWRQRDAGSTAWSCVVMAGAARPAAVGLRAGNHVAEQG